MLEIHVHVCSLVGAVETQRYITSTHSSDLVNCLCHMKLHISTSYISSTIYLLIKHISYNDYYTQQGKHVHQSHTMVISYHKLSNSTNNCIHNAATMHQCISFRLYIQHRIYVSGTNINSSLHLKSYNLYIVYLGTLSLNQYIELIHHTNIHTTLKYTHCV